MQHNRSKLIYSFYEQLEWWDLLKHLNWFLVCRHFELIDILNQVYGCPNSLKEPHLVLLKNLIELFPLIFNSRLKVDIKSLLKFSNQVCNMFLLQMWYSQVSRILSYILTYFIHLSLRKFHLQLVQQKLNLC